MKRCSFLILACLGASLLVADPEPQIYYPVSKNKNSVTYSASAPTTASGMETLKLSKLENLHEMSVHQYGKLEEIQHQIDGLHQKIADLVQKLEHHQKKREAPGVDAKKPLEAEQPQEAQKNPMEKPEQAGPLKKEMVSAVEEKEPKEKDAVKKPTPDMPEKKGEATTGETKPVAETQEQEKKMVATNQVAQDPKGETAEGTDGQALPPKLEMSDAEQQYQKISSLIVQGNYKQARLDLQGFVETYPHHTLTPSAYYWLGETYFIEKNYVEAAKTFLKGYKVNESSHKVNDILLKLAMSLGALDRKTEACKTYEKLRNSKIPLSATHKHIAEKEEKKLKCGA